ncbi:hypothetical protein QFC21_000009 [Naganishia friedmannii]|uniref:Uncharacterized protein n=1 Tax=Naganishia friedmannii TaxID=89922 RepID=A0ACC2WBX0_9TREE|nr:hypothetical protein QFC21_000009 [Naganishia friedmannii]
MTTDNDAEYRAALAAYHATLRENFLSFLWSRPAHESFTAERNGFAELEQTSGNVFDLKPARSEKRNGRVFDSLDVLASPAASTVSRLPASSVTSFASMSAITVPTSPVLEKSVNAINPLTGRRVGSDPRLPTPPGREFIRQQARGRARRPQHASPQSKVTEGLSSVVLGTQSISAPSMERSRPDKCTIQQTRTDLPSCPEISIFGGQSTIPPQRKIRNAHSYPVGSVNLRRTTSSSTFGERGIASATQRRRDTSPPDPSSPTSRCDLSRLHAEPKKTETRQAPHHDSRHHRMSLRNPPGLLVSKSAEGWSDEEIESESGERSEPSSASEGSSHSSLAVTSPVVRSGSPSRSVIPGRLSASAEGATILIRRHADNLHYPSAISPIRHLSPPIYEVMAKYHRLPLDRRNSGTTLTDMTPRTEFSEASFTALAPSPLFATETHSAPSSSHLDTFPGLNEAGLTNKYYEQDSTAACPPPKQQHFSVDQLMRLSSTSVLDGLDDED